MKLLTDVTATNKPPAVGGNTRQRRGGAFAQIGKIMKLTCILMTVAFLHVSAGGFSQQVTLSLKDAPLEKVFREIEHQTGFGFLYNKKMLADFPNVTIEVKNANIEKVLDQCFSAAKYEYLIVNQTIVIREKNQPPRNLSEKAIPPGDIHGHITDSAGNPLVGASVAVKGSKNGTQTDEHGDFSLKGVDNNATLLVSYTGFEPQTVKLIAGKEIRIQLRGSMSKLDEMVVKGYYSTTNRLNTGDVTTVKGEDIQKQPVSDPILALVGRVPGLYIQQTSGVPGAYSTIRIRGQNSIANGNNPLYIVDGVPYNSKTPTSGLITGSVLGTPNGGDGQGASPFNDLNPADIESIEVLKDADATAIYMGHGERMVLY